jgi:trk system potassium uptake protein
MRIVIANGNKQAEFIIAMFKNKANQLTVINSSRDFANDIVKKEHIPVFIGNPWRNYVLEQAGVHDADVLISLSDKDTDNYATCILAKRIFNVKKCICVVNNPKNVDLYKRLGIDSVISSTYLLAQTIKSESSMESLMKTLSLENDKIIVIEAPVLSRYAIANKRIMDINFPKYASIAAIYRNFSVLIPNGQVEIKPKDQLLIVCAPEDQKKIFEFLQESAPSPSKKESK